VHGCHGQQQQPEVKHAAAVVNLLRIQHGHDSMHTRCLFHKVVDLDMISAMYNAELN
jgi:hypothetical protein